MRFPHVTAGVAHTHGSLRRIHRLFPLLSCGTKTSVPNFPPLAVAEYKKCLWESSQPARPPRLAGTTLRLFRKSPAGWRLRTDSSTSQMLVCVIMCVHMYSEYESTGIIATWGFGFLFYFCFLHSHNHPLNCIKEFRHRKRLIPEEEIQVPYRVYYVSARVTTVHNL